MLDPVADTLPWVPQKQSRFHQENRVPVLSKLHSQLRFDPSDPESSHGQAGTTNYGHTHTQHASTYKHEQFGSLPESNGATAIPEQMTQWDFFWGEHL